MSRADHLQVIIDDLVKRVNAQDALLRRVLEVLQDIQAHFDSGAGKP